MHKTNRKESPSPSVRLVLDKLEDVRRDGDEWRAKCPVHPDSSPSLEIREGDDGRALLMCYAGCYVDKEILPALGLTMRDILAGVKTANTPTARTAKSPFGSSGSQQSDSPVRTRIRSKSGTVCDYPAADTALASIDDWQEPGRLPAELPPVPPFTLDLLPASLRPWVADITARMQCPPEYAAVAAIVALSSLVARRVAILPKAQDDWRVIPNLWGTVIGPPGVLKTPAMAEALRPLKCLETKAAGDHEMAQRRQEACKLLAGAERAAQQELLKQQLKNGADRDVLIQRLVETAAESQLLRIRYLVNDTTVEALTEILRDNPGGVLAYRDELLALLHQLDREGQEHARAFYLEGWNGGESYESNRIGRGDTRVPDNTLAILGGIQPGPLRAYLRSGVPGRQDDGFIQRFQLMVYPDVPVNWENVDRRPDREAKDRAGEVFTSLASLDRETLLARGAEEAATSVLGTRLFFRFAPDAQAAFDSWRAGLERRVRADDEHPAYIAHLAKYRSLVPSLALILHIADHHRGAVGLDALAASLSWAEYLELHARRVYASVIGADTVPAHALAAKLRSGALPDGFARREVYRRQWTGLTTREDVERAVGLLVQLHWLREEETGNTEGRPGTVYRIHPRLRKTR